jgi:DNA-binding transcriptional MerR regulator
MSALARAAAPSAPPAPPAPPTPVYRMKDLCERTGLSRQAIHFYIQQGLLPEGRKTGRNMAWYGPEHVARLAQIRRLQEERCLPLKTIRALLDGETAHLDPARRTLLAEVASRIGHTLGADGRPQLVDAAEAAARHAVPLDDVRRLAALGLIASRPDPDDPQRLRISSEALWLLDVWGQFRALGFTPELGFSVDDLQVYEQAVAGLFQQETSLLVERLAALPAERVATMLERALPLIHAVLIHLHTAAVRHLLTAVAARDGLEETP